MLKSIASAFFEIEPSKKEGSIEPSPSSKEEADTPVTQPTGAAPPPAPLIGAVDQQMAEVLASAIEAANIDGFDYIEFRNALTAMSNIPMPEQAKFQSVFATAQTMGATKDKILDSIDHYQGILESKRAEFMAQVEAMMQAEIASRQAKKEQMEQEIAQLTEQIQTAQLRIAEAQQEILKISSEINQEDLNIKNTSASFEATYNFMTGKLQEDKNKIQTYLAS